MSIERILPDLPQNHEIQTGASGKAEAAQTHKIDSVKPFQKDNDASELSDIGKFMAAETIKIIEDQSVRQEKIDQFRDFANSDVEITDTQIDTIINRMLNS